MRIGHIFGEKFYITPKKESKTEFNFNFAFTFGKTRSDTNAKLISKQLIAEFV